MNEAAENGSSLWPIITLGIYWAYLIAIREQRRRKGIKTFFDHILAQHKTEATHNHNANWFTGLASRPNEIDEARFLIDAVKIYEFILANYAAGKMVELVGLLSPDVFDVFSNHIEGRTNRGERLSLDIVTLSDAIIVAKDISNTLSEITVRFEADILVSKKNTDPDHSLYGSPELLTAIDLWTFQKRKNAAGGNWILVAVEMG
tara:strand:- start:1609 stop:2220 length:612 start_codon:yes stop_codon:yes gene_type:complete